jgi:hypothetical protein
MLVIISITTLIVAVLVFMEIRDKLQDIKLLEAVTKRNRGTRTERDLVLKLLKHGIAPQAIFHDLYVKKINGSFSQVDLVVATKVGLIVFEVKDYSGWIFGAGHQSQWTQVLAYGNRKYRFYNPIMQNSKHITELKTKLKQFQSIPFFSVVAFYGSCQLRDISFIPKGTFVIKSNRIFETIETIIQNNEPAMYSNKNEIVKVLAEASKNGEDQEAQIQHIKTVRQMLGKDMPFN